MFSKKKRSALTNLGVLLLNFSIVGGASAGSPSDYTPKDTDNGGSSGSCGCGYPPSKPPTLERP